MLSGVDENAKNEGDNTEKMLEKWYGVKLLTRQEFKVGDKDFTPQLLAAKQTNPDIIVTLAQVPEVSILLRQARELGIKLAIMGSPAAVDNGVIAGAGLNAEGYTGGWLSGLFLGFRSPRHGKVSRGVGKVASRRVEGAAEPVRRARLQRNVRRRRGDEAGGA